MTSIPLLQLVNHLFLHNMSHMHICFSFPSSFTPPWPTAHLFSHNMGPHNILPDTKTWKDLSLNFTSSIHLLCVFGQVI